MIVRSLKEMRKRAPRVVTQDVIAAAIPMSKASYSNWERNQAVPREWEARLSDVYLSIGVRVSVDQIRALQRGEAVEVETIGTGVEACAAA